MISILLVEDNLIKAGKIRDALLEVGVGESEIDHCLTASDAVTRLKRKKYDLLLLDVNLPRRLGEGPQRGGGISIIREIDRNKQLNKPRYIAGITAFEDILEEFGDDFASKLWTLILYRDNSESWKSQITAKVKYIRAVRLSENFSDGVTHGVDLAVVCALPLVELAAIRRLDCDWQPQRIPHDQTSYFSGVIKRATGGDISVIAAAAPRMGIAASAVLASKMISTFRPRYLAMTGICAGRLGKSNYGDIVVAEPSWDWGSGKMDSFEGQARFRPLPHQLDMDVDFASSIEQMCDNVELLARIKRDARGKKPDTELRARVAPMASGAAVIANPKILEELLDDNRGLMALEMEAYGVASACNGSSKPRPLCLIVKSVCDFADEDKSDDFQEYAAETSSRFLYQIALELM